ncbi:MAG: hypothetical protein LC748_11405 [Thermomicrobia bacterium]|nr:hypothetical protein [Thermomicrobia bacterium]
MALLAALTLLLGPLSASADPGKGGKPATGQTKLHKGALPPKPQPSKPQQLPKSMPDIKKISPTTKPLANVDPIDQKILVITADGTEADLPAITQSLDFLGLPYTVYTAKNTPGGLTSDKLIDPANSIHAFYQGVILTTGALGICCDAVGHWYSALTQQEWTNLANFEVAFGVRQITWYTYPTPDYGFNYPTGSVDWTSSLTAPFTAAGKTIFGSYANTATPVEIRGASTYLATPLTDGNTQPLLADGAGNVVGAVRSYKDSTGTLLRENLALTFDSAPSLTHNLVLSYGVINWVTKGVFLGERHVYLDPQPDDFFIDDDMWSPSLACGTNLENTGITFRLTGNDLKAFTAWQQAKQGQAITTGLKTEMPFNGIGTTADWIATEGTSAGQYSPDTLTPTAKTNQAQFNWISHTWDHENLDSATYDMAYSELTQNNKAANQLGLKSYTKSTLVTPDVSGLMNPNFLQAAYDVGVRYLVSNTSIAGYNNPSPNAGIYNPYQPAMLMIPRHPVNLYFNVSTPQEWLAEDNCIYPAGAYGNVGTYQQLLDRESTVLLSYLLKGDVDPLMFHQPNLRAYDGMHSVLGDLLDATFAKYSALFTLPIRSLTQQQIGQKMANRMTYNASGATAQIVPGKSITLPLQ